MCTHVHTYIHKTQIKIKKLLDCMWRHMQYCGAILSAITTSWTGPSCYHPTGCSDTKAEPQPHSGQLRGKSTWAGRLYGRHHHSCQGSMLFHTEVLTRLYPSCFDFPSCHKCFPGLTLIPYFNSYVTVFCASEARLLFFFFHSFCMCNLEDRFEKSIRENLLSVIIISKLCPLLLFPQGLP